MKVGKKVLSLMILWLTVLSIINAEAGNGLVIVKLNIENKTSDKTLKLRLWGENPKWSGEDRHEGRVVSLTPDRHVTKPLSCKIRGDCKEKVGDYTIAPGETVKFEEDFADDLALYLLEYCGRSIEGPVFRDHKRDLDRCSTNLKMSVDENKRELKITLTPLEEKNDL